MNAIDDRQVLERLASGDSRLRDGGLKFLYKTHYPAVEAFVMRQKGSAEDARDLFQEALMAFYGQVRKGSFRGESGIGTYLFAITKRMWWQRLRKGPAQEAVLELREGDGGEADDLAEALERKERREIVERLLRQLEADCARVLKLFFFQRLSMKEIAQSMGFANEQTAKNKKYKCFKRLAVLATEHPYWRKLIEEIS